MAKTDPAVIEAEKRALCAEGELRAVLRALPQPQDLEEAEVAATVQLVVTNMEATINFLKAKLSGQEPCS